VSDTSARRGLFLKSLAFPVAAFSLFGCLPQPTQTTESAAAPAPVIVSEISAGGKTVRATSSPKEVAEVALAAIGDNDSATLLKLIAIDQVRSDVLKITGGRAAFQKQVENAPTTAVVAIMAEITPLDPMSRTVGVESIKGEQATVTVQGIRAGKPQDQMFYFVREGGWWKLVPSHR
jgi:hypothetical protein